MASFVCLHDFKNQRDSTHFEKVENTFSNKKLKKVLIASCRQSLATWFSVGLLQLQPIHWESSSAALLEKVMTYEAVHPMQGWQDLKQRLGPMRRCPALHWPQRANKHPLHFVQFTKCITNQSLCLQLRLECMYLTSPPACPPLFRINLSAEEQLVDALLNSI